jgi:Tfp pilus assembly protein PilV
MKLRTSQSGFSVIEFVIIALVVVAIGVVGFTVYNRQQNKNNITDNDTATVAQSPTANDVKSAPAVSSTKDLDDASKVVDQTDVEGGSNTDSGQLDSQLSAF